MNQAAFATHVGLIYCTILRFPPLSFTPQAAARARKRFLYRDIRLRHQVL